MKKVSTVAMKQSRIPRTIDARPSVRDEATRSPHRNSKPLEVNTHNRRAILLPFMKQA